MNILKSKKLLTVGTLVLAGLVSIPAFSNKTQKNEKIILSKNNLISLKDEFNPQTVGVVIEEARKKGASGLFSSSKDPIYLFLDTPGGQINSGMEMIEALKGLDRKVHTVTLFAASMGFQTVQALGDRLMLRGGSLMSHRARGGFSGEFGGQKPSQIDSRKGFWEQIIQEMDELTVKRTNGKQTLESYQTSYVPELWLTATQAIEKGYADRIVTVECDSSLSGFVTHTEDVLGILTVSYDTSECPLNSAILNIKVTTIETNKGKMSMEEFEKNSGGYGIDCYVKAASDANLICASNPNISYGEVLGAKSLFYKNKVNSKKAPIPYIFE